MDWAWLLKDVLCTCPLSLLIFKVSGVEQDSVPYMMKVILTHIPFECGVVYPNVYGLFNGFWLSHGPPSLPKIMMISVLVLCPVWVLCPWKGEGSFRCLYIFSRRSWMFLLCTPHCMWAPHTDTSRWPYSFFLKESLSLGLTSIFLMVLLPLKWVWMPYFLHICLILSPSPCVKGITIFP